MFGLDPKAGGKVLVEEAERLESGLLDEVLGEGLGAAVDPGRQRDAERVGRRVADGAVEPALGSRRPRDGQRNRSGRRVDGVRHGARVRSRSRVGLRDGRGGRGRRRAGRPPGGA